MNMRKTGLLLTGGLAAHAGRFHRRLMVYSWAPKQCPFTLRSRSRRPPISNTATSPCRAWSKALTRSICCRISTVWSDAPTPSFAFVDTDGSGNTVSSVGVFDGPVATPVITFGDTPTRITLNDVTVSGADAIPAAGEVRVVGGSIAIVGNHQQRRVRGRRRIRREC